jgi:hypothetical protein
MAKQPSGVWICLLRLNGKKRVLHMRRSEYELMRMRGVFRLYYRGAVICSSREEAMAERKRV